VPQVIPRISRHYSEWHEPCARALFRSLLLFVAVTSRPIYPSRQESWPGYRVPEHPNLAFELQGGGIVNGHLIPDRHWTADGKGREASWRAGDDTPSSKAAGVQ
jgi:hypothetical protein